MHTVPHLLLLAVAYDRILPQVIAGVSADTFNSQPEYVQSFKQTIALVIPGATPDNVVDVYASFSGESRRQQRHLQQEASAPPASSTSVSFTLAGLNGNGIGSNASAVYATVGSQLASAVSSGNFTSILRTQAASVGADGLQDAAVPDLNLLGIVPNPTTPPTPEPSPLPSLEPTPNPTQPTVQPSPRPTVKPTVHSTSSPSCRPSVKPTTTPSVEPTASPSTEPPTHTPAADPTEYPTAEPTSHPIAKPTANPTTVPTTKPTSKPTTARPSAGPTARPTANPSPEPTVAPTNSYSYIVESSFSSTRTPCTGLPDKLYIRPVDTCVSFPNGSLIMTVDQTSHFPAVDFTETWFRRRSDCQGHTVVLNYSYSATCQSVPGQSVVTTVVQGAPAYAFPQGGYLVTR